MPGPPDGAPVDRSRGSGGGIAGAVLVTVDSMRADALPDEGASAMASLARRGTVFERAFAHGNWTPLSFPGLLAGRHPFVDDGDVGVRGTTTLAERLSAEGVRTGGFNAANGFLTEHWGYDRGFDCFRTFTGDTAGSAYRRYLAAHPTVQAWLGYATAPLKKLAGPLRDEDRRPMENVSHMRDVERSAVDFLADAPEPFFCWVHFMDVHTPYVPTPASVRAVTGDAVGALRMVRAHARTGLGLGVDDSTLDRLRTLYAATVEQVDRSVGRILDALDRRGIRDRTAVVLAGDHGEEFQEHGHLAHYPKLYDELVRVPLVVDHPELDPAVVERPVGLASVPATVCDSLGVAPAAGFERPSLLAPGRGDRSPVISTTVRGESVTQQPIPRRPAEGELVVAARTDRLTYVYAAGSGTAELYDRATDLGERENLLDATGALPADVDGQLGGSVEELHRAVTDHLARVRDAGTSTTDHGEGGVEPVPDSVSTRLEALGYQ